VGERRRARVLFLGPGLYGSGYREIRETFRADRLVRVEVSDDHRDIRPRHALVVSLGYRRIIPAECLGVPAMGTVVFHSSDLPKGRGWAPLYHALAERRRRHTVSLFYASPGIDDGPLIAKAHCPISPTETLTSLRRKDDVLVLALLKRYLARLARRRVPGRRQVGTPTFHRRRTPDDSRVDAARPLRELFFTLRALDNDRYPGFFMVGGERFFVRITPAEDPVRAIHYRLVDFFGRRTTARAGRTPEI
jgi:methionyl-tRNA formyltransferase